MPNKKGITLLFDTFRNKLKPHLDEEGMLLRTPTNDLMKNLELAIMILKAACTLDNQLEGQLIELQKILPKTKEKIRGIDAFNVSRHPDPKGKDIDIDYFKELIPKLQEMSPELKEQKFDVLTPDNKLNMLSNLLAYTLDRAFSNAQELTRETPHLTSKL